MGKRQTVLFLLAAFFFVGSLSSCRKISYNIFPEGPFGIWAGFWDGITGAQIIKNKIELPEIYKLGMFLAEIVILLTSYGIGFVTVLFIKKSHKHFLFIIPYGFLFGMLGYISLIISSPLAFWGIYIVIVGSIAIFDHFSVFITWLYKKILL